MKLLRKQNIHRTPWGPRPSCIVSAAVLLTLLHLAAAAAPAQYEATTRAAYDAELAFTLSGRVKKVAVAPGSPVQAGQVLVELDDDEQKLVVELARLEAQSDIAVRLAQHRLEVASKSNAKLAELELEQARHQQLIARERHEHAKVILGQHTLKSPVTGTIERVDVTIGNVVKAGQPIVRLIQSQTLWVDVAVPTAMAQALNVGHAAQVREKQDTPRQAVQGKIVFLGQTIDAATDTRLVRVEIAGPAPDHPDNSTPMLAGVYVTVTFAQPQARLPAPE